MKLIRHIPDRHRAFGMTLIELMVVVAILAIVATVAVSSYRRQVLRSNRVDATSTLLRVQVAQEKFFLQNNRYAVAGELATAPPAGLGISTGATSPGGHYTIALAAPTATTYTVTATATGAQTGDVAACLTFTINEQGVRTPAAATGCWR